MNNYLEVISMVTNINCNCVHITRIKHIYLCSIVIFQFDS